MSPYFGRFYTPPPAPWSFLAGVILVSVSLLSLGFVLAEPDIPLGVGDNGYAPAGELAHSFILGDVPNSLARVVGGCDALAEKTSLGEPVRDLPQEVLGAAATHLLQHPDKPTWLSSPVAAVGGLRGR